MTRLTAARARAARRRGRVPRARRTRGVRAWIAVDRRARSRARYPVDGIHLDYIRQPDVDGRLRPDDARALRAARPASIRRASSALPAAQRARRGRARGAAFQRDQVTAVVREVRDSRATRCGPGCALSAAVVADTHARPSAPRARPGAAGCATASLDRAFLMCYAPPVQTVMDQLVGVAPRRWAPTVASCPGSPSTTRRPPTAAAKIKGARALGLPAARALFLRFAVRRRPGAGRGCATARGRADRADR